MDVRQEKTCYINIIFQFMKPVTTVAKSHMIYHKNHPHFLTFIFTFWQIQSTFYTAAAAVTTTNTNSTAKCDKMWMILVMKKHIISNTMEETSLKICEKISEVKKDIIKGTI